MNKSKRPVVSDYVLVNEILDMVESLRYSKIDNPPNYVDKYLISGTRKKKYRVFENKYLCLGFPLIDLQVKLHINAKRRLLGLYALIIDHLEAIYNLDSLWNCEEGNELLLVQHDIRRVERQFYKSKTIKKRQHKKPMKDNTTLNGHPMAKMDIYKVDIKDNPLKGESPIKLVGRRPRWKDYPELSHHNNGRKITKTGDGIIPKPIYQEKLNFIINELLEDEGWKKLES